MQVRRTTGWIPWTASKWFLLAAIATCQLNAVLVCGTEYQDDLTSEEYQQVAAAEQYRIDAIQQVIGSVVAIYDNDRQGGGSGVIIDPSGIALTNHHVIMGAGIEGWGGLADGKLYKWKLIGTDPGGDVAMIQLDGRDTFPFTPLGDSDLVRVGDWALAMGNPFILTEDQVPTVTLGIVSGVKRYQSGAGLNQLVYGNCIQVDSSINPGNSGGPLFNFNGQVIGINGRGSFKERGRVNVGLGYAISSNQIKNFIPELLATKLVEHATLDASFSDRQGKVVCSQIHLDSPVAEAGLSLEDVLIEFEGIKILNANQFTNLICTLPEGWPVELKIKKITGEEKTIHVRAFGLPYRKPKAQTDRSGKKPTPQQKKQQERQRQMVKLLSAEPGKVRIRSVNRQYARNRIKQWKTDHVPNSDDAAGTIKKSAVKLSGEIRAHGDVRGHQEMWLACDGRFRIEWTLDDQQIVYIFDGQAFHMETDAGTKQMTLIEAKLALPIVQAVSIAAAWQEESFGVFGDSLLDGSDKTLGQVTYRMKTTDEEADVFFFWLPLGDSRRLLKAAASKDCDEGGVTFHDWKDVGPVSLPWRCDFVVGLSEASALSISTQDAEWIPVLDSVWFETESAQRRGDQSEKDQP